MFFNSFSYALFLTIVFVIYWALPGKYRWICLLGVSYYFYTSFGVKYVLLLVATTIISYFGALLIEKADNRRWKKTILVGNVVVFVGALVAFKYLNFLSETICGLLGVFSIKLSAPAIRLMIPVGISFYIFQSLGYVIDVYNDRIKAEHHLGYYALFVSFFPQITSGPIGRADKLLPQYKNEPLFDSSKARMGLAYIIVGLYKKLVVGDLLVPYIDKAFTSYADFSGGGALLIGAIFFAIQIYCDFSGYSDMAIGSAKVLGIDFVENFRSPYLATSLKDFWRRWHISLSTWFRDYLYIPLGGSRCATWRRDCNLVITFLISGAWHGANWTYIVWGGLHGLGQVIENHLKTVFVKAYDISKNRILLCVRRVLNTIVVFIYCTFAWIFFRADTIQGALKYIVNIPRGCTHVGDYIKRGIGDLGILGNIRMVYILMVICILAVVDILNHDGRMYEKLMKLPVIPRILICSCFAAFTCIFAQKGVAAEFVYVQF